MAIHSRNYSNREPRQSRRHFFVMTSRTCPDCGFDIQSPKGETWGCGICEINKREAAKLLLSQITEAQADELHELVQQALTDPAHIATQLKTLAERYAPKPFVPAPDCAHKNEYATSAGMMCRSCHRVREPINEFERRLILKLTPRTNGYVNYGMR